MAEVRTARVLVVDDDRNIRCVAKRMLERRGYEVIVAAGGREAVETLGADAGRIGLVLLDLSMPGMDGTATFRALRRLRADVPVILMSGHGEADASQELPTGAISGFLQKPFSLATLTDTIDEAV